ncbi:type I polyketide synthase [Flavobacterium poyangense]|uniref:type I polyketide synthase n=1 Tax=Flavobacterium poyangense TaxID=2204302 RepID=UPI0014248034|nr:type I polyketide synthase [Flavobacterium sp. JXAS1]
MSENNMSDNSHKIAIIGMSCRLPGADNIDQFWSNLINGKESFSEFTDQELRDSGVDESLINSPNYIRRRGIINGAEYFDATFFGITPRDAEIMDPQHRIFLECAWHALEDAAYNPEKSKARIGVFGGTGVNWHLNSTTNNPEVVKYASGTSIVTGNDKDYVATRVSYKLNLKGPSLTVQCACSTSMAAVIMGVNSLLNYQSDMVLAGGATIELPERRGYLYQEGGLESSDGRCRTFDKDADGTVFSRGAGVVLLKRYDEAVKDGDHIYAVILGSALNNDGNEKVGFTAPSIEGQVDVALEAMELADISADSISYVEAHGTATALGDPIEVTALSKVFRSYTDRKQFCGIGSVKTNIGHTDSASGVAGLIKTALALSNKKIPAHLNFNEPNPKIDFESSPFYVNTELKNWEQTGYPLRAIVNSFGVGGTNACVILEEPPVITSQPEIEKRKILVLSAKTETALATTQSQLHDYIVKNPSLNVDDLAYTYQVGRKSFSHRGFLVYKDREDLLAKLSTEGSLQTATSTVENRPVIFMFPGQGNQYHNMGLHLYEENKLYRDTVDYCCTYLKEEFGFDLRDFLFAKDADKAKQALEQTYITQPAIFVTSYAMALVVMDKGVKPEAFIGHSVGEYVAASLSGIMSLENCLRAVAKRGALIQKLPGGSMLAVLQNEDKIVPHLFEGVEVAAVNNPDLCVIAGTDENIDKLEAILKNSGFFSKRLSTSHAFHSAMMDPCLPEFAEMFADIPLSAPTIPIISTVTGNFLTDDEARNPEYWVRHVRNAVRFTDAVNKCLEMNPTLFLEIGPGQSLESSVKKHLTRDSEHGATRTMTTATETTNHNDFLEAALGQLWLMDGTISWEEYYKDQERKRVALPVYPYERMAYSIDFSKVNKQQTEKTNVRYSDSKDWYSVPVWKRSADSKYLINNASENQTWLIFNDENGLGDKIIDALVKEGKSFCEVVSGGFYNKHNGTKYTIDVANKDHYNYLMKDLLDDDIELSHIVHLFNYTEQSDIIDMEKLDDIENVSFFSPLFLQQALYESGKLKEIQYTLVANGVFDVIGDKVYAPEKALAIGPCRVLIQEFPLSRSRFIDVDFQRTEKGSIKLAENIIRESQNTAYQTLVAYRNNYRWIEGYDRISFEKENTPHYKDGGIYLITGGIGGIGLLTASTIAKEVKATFILTYNSPIPERNEWDKWLEENPGISFTREKIEGVRKLEEIGATIILKQANVANLNEMTHLRNEIESTVGSITGIIHSAGAVGGGVIPLKKPESVRAVFDSKFKGTIVLNKLFENQNLDFFLLYSSVTSILGEGTRLDYCSANAFLDSFSTYRKQIRNDYTCSINWAGWKGTGMAVRWEKEKADKMKIKEESTAPEKIDNTAKTILRNSKDLLTLVKTEGSQSVYEVSFKPENDWIINSHFIINQPTVVGTSFIELAHQFSKMIYPELNVELKNLYFISPLMFENAKDKKVRFIVDEQSNKHKFSFKTQPLEKDADTDLWHDHFVGEMILSENSNELIDIAATKERLNKQVDTGKSFRIVYNSQNMPLIDLGERWDIDNEIHVGDNEWLAKLTLRPEFHGDTDNFDFHPAIMDKATSFALRYTSEATYLPFSYKSVKPFEKIPAEVYAYSTLSNGSSGNGDAISLDIKLIDANGKVLIDIKEYTMKQVNNMPAAPSRKQDRDKATADILSDTFDYIHPDQGEEVIKHILQCEFSEQLIVYPCDFDFMLEDNLPDLQKRAEKDQKAKENKSYYSRPALSTTYVEPANEMEKTIAKIWQDILGIDKIGRYDTFTDLGGNSLVAIQTIANMVDVLEVDLSAQVFYDNPTIKGMAEAVVASIMGMDDIENLESIIESMNLEN